MKLFQIGETRIPFERYAKLLLPLSAILVVLSLGLFMFRGLNYGVDFRGGSVILIETSSSYSVADIRDLAAKDIGEEVSVTSFGTGLGSDRAQYQIRIGATGEDAAAVGQVQEIANAIEADLPETEVLKITSIGGTVSGELVVKGIEAVGATLLAISIYIWLRFEWQFSIGAVVSLIHDVSLTLGLFALLQITFDLNIVAAILTIIGYSLNDTVVVYDRIRENLRRFKSMELSTVTDNSINETLRRTLMTSITTLIALVTLYMLGGAELRGFTFAMIWGVLVGTYSSIFVASPILNLIGVDRGDKANKAPSFADVDA